MHTKFWPENIKGRPRHTWDENIIMDLRVTEREGADWINLAQNRDK
jgi:hypothetical protein